MTEERTVFPPPARPRPRRLPPLALAAGLLLAALPACDAGDGPTAPTSPVAELPAGETFAVEGAPGPLRLVTDDLGVRHVYGQGLTAALFGQGYVTARDRLWQMDVFRRLARGRLSSLLGEVVLGLDVELRTFMLTRQGEPLEEALSAHIQATSPETFGLIEAYAAGVNAYIADVAAERNGAELPAEYDFFLVDQDVDDLPAWTPEDSLAIARLQQWQLSASDGGEIARWEIKNTLPEAVFKDVFRLQPAIDALTIDDAAAAGTVPGTAEPTSAADRNIGADLADRPGKPAPDDAAVGAPAAPRAAPALPDGLRDRLRQVRRALQERRDQLPMLAPGIDGLGSNNWVVAPELSASGNAMLANDPHLSLPNPPIWHVIHLDPTYAGGRGIPIQGVMFPGLPGVILGYNRYVAWGGTVAGYDVTDVYLEEVETPDDYPASPRTVAFQGERVEVIRKEFEFTFPDGSARTVPIEIVPHHGPQVADPDLDDDVEGLAAGANMSVRWTGHELSNDVDMLLGLNQAKSVTAAVDALRDFAVGAQNWVLADVYGNIAYFPHGWIPRRPAGTVPWLPMDGTGGAEWKATAEGSPAWVAEADLPQAFNPEAGWLSTANNDLRGDLLDNDPLDDGVYLYADRAAGFRQGRIRDMLTNADGSERNQAAITMEDMGRYQNDVYSKEAEAILPHLFDAAEAASDGALGSAAINALGRLKAWTTTDVGPLQVQAGLDPASVRDDVGDGTAATNQQRRNSTAASIYYAFLARLVDNALGDELAALDPADYTGSDASKALIHLLNDEGETTDGNKLWTADPATGSSILWDDTATTAVTETRDGVLLASLEDAVGDLVELFGTDNQSLWIWGEIHTLTLQSFFAQAGIETFDLGQDPPFPVDGGRYTVSPTNFNATAPLSETTPGAGASMRLIVEMTPSGPVAFNAIPGGESGDGTPPGDDDPAYDEIRPGQLYGHWLPLWLRGERFQYRFTDADVAANAATVWDLKAAEAASP